MTGQFRSTPGVVKWQDAPRHLGLPPPQASPAGKETHAGRMTPALRGLRSPVGGALGPRCGRHRAWFCARAPAPNPCPPLPLGSPVGRTPEGPPSKTWVGLQLLTVSVAPRVKASLFWFGLGYVGGGGGGWPAYCPADSSPIYPNKAAKPICGHTTSANLSTLRTQGNPQLLSSSSLILNLEPSRRKSAQRRDMTLHRDADLGADSEVENKRELKVE